MKHDLRIHVDSLPTFAIILWNGPQAAVPKGWAICDGNNGTPNLTDRFVRACPSDNQRGKVTGQNQVTIHKNQLPPHTHPASLGFADNAGTIPETKVMAHTTYNFEIDAKSTGTRNIYDRGGQNAVNTKDVVGALRVLVQPNEYESGVPKQRDVPTAPEAVYLYYIMKTA